MPLKNGGVNLGGVRWTIENYERGSMESYLVVELPGVVNVGEYVLYIRYVGEYVLYVRYVGEYVLYIEYS